MPDLTDLPSAIALALAWPSGTHRVPEPLAVAHTLSRHALHGELPCDAEV